MHTVPDEPVGCRGGSGLDRKAGHVATAADRVGLQGMRQRTVQAEPDVLRLGVRTVGLRRRCVDVEQDVVTVEPEVGHRHVPAEHGLRSLRWRRPARRTGARCRRRGSTPRSPTARPPTATRLASAPELRCGHGSWPPTLFMAPHQVSRHQPARGGQRLVLHAGNDHDLALGGVGEAVPRRRLRPRAT